MSLARVRALLIIGVLVVCAIVLAVIAVVKDQQPSRNYTTRCPPGAVLVVTKPLPDEQDIKLYVYNGAGTPGLANDVADKFRNRKFTVDKVGDTTHADGVAVIKYGPKTVAAATVVNAYFLNDGVLQFDLKSTDDHITVVIGSQYRTIGTPTDVHQAIAAQGNPSPPAGTCSVS